MNELEAIDNQAKDAMNQETARIAWHELQRFFANGTAIWVNDKLDLLEVAQQISIDNTAQVEQWMQQQQVCKVSDEQALTWFNDNAEVWAVVVKPWILVQQVQSR